VGFPEPRVATGEVVPLISVTQGKDKIMKKSLVVLSVALGVVTCGVGASVPDELIFYSKFDSAADIASPAVGVAGTDAGATFVSGKDGNALLVPAHAVVARFPFSSGLPVDKFCMEFYGKIMNSSDSFADKCDPFLFGMKTTSTKQTAFELYFTSNNGGGRSGLICGGGGVCISTWNTATLSPLYSSILGQTDPKGWHKYTIRWNKNGLDGQAPCLAVHIDGAKHISGITQKDEVDALTTMFGQSLELLFSNVLENQTHGRSPIALDEFKVWKTDTPKEEDDPVLPVVSAVTAKQHYPWCGKIDIGYTVAGSTDGLMVKISVKDNDNNVTYEAKTFDTAPTAAVGAHTVVWDATKDGVNKVSKNMVATVSLIVPEN